MRSIDYEGEMSNQPPPGWSGAPRQWQPPPPQSPAPPPPAWQQQQPPSYGGYQPPSRGKPGVNALAVVSLVAGIVWIFGLGSLIAVICGAIALIQVAKSDQGGKGLAIAGLALGVVGILGAILTFATIAAVDEEFDESADDAAVVRVEAAPNVCYTVTLTASKGGISQSQNEACGPRQFDLGQGLGRNAIITKSVTQAGRSGPVTAVLTVNGEEKDRQTTNTEFGSVTLSP